MAAEAGAKPHIYALGRGEGLAHGRERPFAAEPGCV